MIFYDFTGVLMTFNDRTCLKVIWIHGVWTKKRAGTKGSGPFLMISGYFRAIAYSHVMTRRPKYVVSRRFWVLATRLLYSLLTPRRMLQRPFLVSGMSRALSW